MNRIGFVNHRLTICQAFLELQFDNNNDTKNNPSEPKLKMRKLRNQRNKNVFKNYGDKISYFDFFNFLEKDMGFGNNG